MSAHTPGALRAAKEIVEATQELMPDTILRAASMIDKTAALIDRETAAPELLEALKELAAWWENWADDEASEQGLKESLRCSIAAIAKAESES